ncbi:MAG: SAM-dependent methyltransferase [Saprospiraceae bacterium]
MGDGQIPGRLLLLPVPLSGGQTDQLGGVVLEQFRQTRYFLAERPKTARQVLKAIDHPLPQSQLEVREISTAKPEDDLQWMRPLIAEGYDIGIMSEAGLPCIADPGHLLVLGAHRRGIRVLCYPGPNSMLMALMASGLNGQQFCFHGYLPRKKDELQKKLHDLGKLCLHQPVSQIWMETPYRNLSMMNAAVAHLPGQLTLSVSIQLGTPLQQSLTHKVKQWKEIPFDFIADVPAIFVLGNTERSD